MRQLAVLVFVVSLLGCGGGGSGRDAPVSQPTPVTPETLAVIDGLPVPLVVGVSPQLGVATFSHLGFNDLSVSHTGACTDATVVYHGTQDLSQTQFTQMLAHHLRCAQLAENANIGITAAGTRDDASRYESEYAFSTGTAVSPSIVVQDSVTLPATTLVDLLADYLVQELLLDLDLPTTVAPLIAPLVADLVGSNWPNLATPVVEHAAITQRVSYVSQSPDGGASTNLSGLVSLPDPGAGFVARDRVVVLAHSTGVTPSELDPTDAWYLMAGLLASRGYVVVAPDNWGRGATAAEPETYLMANRTAVNAWDLVRAVLRDPAYADVLPTGDVSLALVGYSQGGHSALGLWQLLVTQGPDDVVVSDVLAGGGPYDLYKTFRGVVQQVDGTCSNDPYCRLVDPEAALPFAINRILPGYLNYAASNLTLDEVASGGEFRSSFVEGFLQNDAAYDALKQLMQLSSFPNVTSAERSYTRSNSEFVLYHSSYDRLVPAANQTDLVAMLDGQNIDDQSALCETPEFATIFALTDFVGIVHSLCGIAMIDDVLGRLP